MRKQKRRTRNQQNVQRQTNFSGQHFLRSKKVASEIVDIAKVKTSDTVLDLGAGSGRLTELLAERAAAVWAVEYDAKWVAGLQEKFAKQPHVRVLHQNLLQLKYPRTSFVVVASLPYAITTAALRSLLHPQNQFQRGLFVIEKGTMLRFTADPIIRPEILYWRMWFEFRRGKTLPAQLFSPPPSVSSAILQVRRKVKPFIDARDHNRFLALAKYGLKYPRAPIDQVLRGIFTPKQMTHLRRNLALGDMKRISQLTVAQWALVFQTMKAKVPPNRWPRM